MVVLRRCTKASWRRRIRRAWRRSARPSRTRSRRARSPGGSYEFAEIVDKQKRKTLEIFKTEAQSLAIPGIAWSNFKAQYLLFEKELDEVSCAS